jgi:tetratricopeptide (TPR) repeat protein
MPPTSDSSSRIGPYRLMHELGQGGMGVVYLAQRDDQFHQRVAVKIVRHGVDTPETMERFLAERQILASLSHPNISRLLDGGVTEDGRPYLVLEYVEGEPIDVYCRRLGLASRDRVRLFLQVTRAVHYAHRNLIVHRDLKPNNILVTADEQVKLLDFGIAKILDDSALPFSGPAPRTQTGLWVMTPEYASPEQVRGDPVTTATDVYGLGLVLYEILTGEKAQTVTSLAPAALDRAICETDPPRRLTGDLDRIVAMALRKEAERRYASAERLADDLARYLDGEPVAARGDSLVYVARKFVVRHRWAVASSVAVIGLLIGWAGTVTVKEAAVSRALAEAEIEAAKAEQVTAFLTSVFEASDPAAARGASLTARELLDRGVARVDSLAPQPLVQAEVLGVIGRVYQNLGEHARARPLLERSLAIRLEQLGENDPEVARSYNRLGNLLRLQGEYVTATEHLRKAAAIHRGADSSGGLALATDLHDLASVLTEQGQLEEAGLLFEEALAIRRRELGEEHVDVAESLSGLGWLASERGDYPASERRYREALELRRRLLPENHPETAYALHNVATALERLGRYDQAERLHLEALEVRRQVFGAKHPSVATGLNNLGIVLLRKGDHAGGVARFREALAMRRALLGEDHPSTLITMNNLAAGLTRMQAYPEAERLLRTAIETQRKREGPESPALATSLTNLATVQTRLGKHGEAEANFHIALDMERKAHGDEHPGVASTTLGIGILRREQRRYPEADSLMRSAIAMRVKLMGADHPETKRAHSELAILYERWGRRAAADSLRAIAGSRSS